ncbi:MAG: MurR/RpiR family transcriptional regulator [Pleomorphochaeta sp.]
MIHIDFTSLNKLEKQIHQTLLKASETKQTLRITEAAELCGCSVSKISKVSKKIGFTNFKQYVDFLYNKETIKKSESIEIDKINEFITNFDFKAVDEIIELINSHEKIILFGYGPSLLLAQYFEYRLRTVCPKAIMAVVDKLSVNTMTDSSSLLLIFTATGAYRDFKDIYNTTSAKGAEVVIIAQNYNLSLTNQCDNIIYLSNYSNPKELAPFEQSRTLSFIFMEEVIQKIITTNKLNK